MKYKFSVRFVIALVIALWFPGVVATMAAPYPQGTAFPLIMYEVGSADVPNVAPYGWNVIQSYGLNTNSTLNGYLQMAAANGLYGDAHIPCTPDTGTGATEWPESSAAAWIQGSMTNNNIAWWDLPEEMRSWYPSEVQILHDYRTWVRLYDTNGPRPTYEVNYRDPEAPGIVTNADILAIEDYGPGGGGLTNGASAFSPSHASVRYTVQQLGLASIRNAGAVLGSNYLAGQKTLVIGLDCAAPNAGLPTPTPQQCYHDFWSAVASGAQGIYVWSYYHALHATPSMTNNLAQYNLAASQISGTELGQVVLFGTPDTNVNFAVTAGPTITETFLGRGGTNWSYPSINLMCKTWSNNVYLIAVNSTSNSVAADFTNLSVVSATATVMFESRSLTVSGSGFSDTFAPWGVHVYKMQPVIVTLTYNAGTGGTINGTTPQTVNYGASGTAVTAVPNSGYYFVDWSDGSTTNPRMDANVTNNVTVTANFVINTYTLTYNAGANGSISGTSPQSVNYGSSGSAVTAVPKTGCYFVNWSDGSTANPRTDSNVTNNVTVTANFAVNTYTLTYSAGANGSISGTSPQTVNYGSNGSAMTAVPNTGYHFVNWSDGSVANPRTDANVTNNVTVTVNFAINTYTLIYNAGANGTISGPSPQTVNYGASGSAVTAVSNSGYTFTNWSDGLTANPRTDMGVTSNITVTANFVATSLPVSAPWTTNKIGTITAAVNATVSSGTYSITGGGSGISGKNDNFWYVCLPCTNDVTITARVASQQSASSSAQAGVMIRETLATGSRHAFMGLNPVNGADYIRRFNSSGNSSTTTDSGLAAPYWVQLARSGNTFTGSISSNGVNWVMVSSATVNMSTNAQVGFVVCSGSSSSTNLTVFDNVSISGGVQLPQGTNPVATGEAFLTGFGRGLETSQMSVHGASGDVWTLETSTDMKTWTPLQTFTVINGQVVIEEGDAGPEPQPQQYFRLQIGN